MEVPDVLLSGNHEKIRKWRLKKRLEKTLANRPDLIAQARLKGQLTSEAEQMIEEITNQAGVKLSLKKRKRKSK